MLVPTILTTVFSVTDKVSVRCLTIPVATEVLFWTPPWIIRNIWENCEIGWIDLKPYYYFTRLLKISNQFFSQTFVASGKYIHRSRKAIPSGRILGAHIECVFATLVQWLPLNRTCLRISWQRHREGVNFIRIFPKTTSRDTQGSVIHFFRACKSILFFVGGENILYEIECKNVKIFEL